MGTKSKVDNLWMAFENAITIAYKQANSAEPAACLRDYARDISWNDDLAKLVGRETANERQHRSNNRSPANFSVGTAAKLILMNAASNGAHLTAMPGADIFLRFRHTAAEAEVIGYLVRAHLNQSWHDELATLDYAKLMKEAS